MLRHNARPISKGTINTDWGPVELCVYEESFPTEAVWSGNTPGSGMMPMPSAVEVYWEKKDIWAFGESHVRLSKPELINWDTL